MKKDVVLWTHIPSHHTIGPFRELANSRNVYCMCRKATSKLRGDIWKTPDFGALRVEYLLEKDDVKVYIADFLDKTSDAVHFRVSPSSKALVRTNNGTGRDLAGHDVSKGKR